jgi:hypothetical protein
MPFGLGKLLEEKIWEEYDDAQPPTKRQRTEDQQPLGKCPHTDIQDHYVDGTRVCTACGVVVDCRWVEETQYGQEYRPPTSSFWEYVEQHRINTGGKASKFSLFGPTGYTCDPMLGTTFTVLPGQKHGMGDLGFLKVANWVEGPDANRYHTHVKRAPISSLLLSKGIRSAVVQATFDIFDDYIARRKRLFNGTTTKGGVAEGLMVYCFLAAAKKHQETYSEVEACTILDTPMDHYRKGYRLGQELEAAEIAEELRTEVSPPRPMADPAEYLRACKAHKKRVRRLSSTSLISVIQGVNPVEAIQTSKRLLTTLTTGWSLDSAVESRVEALILDTIEKGTLDRHSSNAIVVVCIYHVLTTETGPELGPQLKTSLREKLQSGAVSGITVGTVQKLESQLRKIQPPT